MESFMKNIHKYLRGNAKTNLILYVSYTFIHNLAIGNL
jgi:hypothetical protein